MSNPQAFTSEALPLDEQVVLVTGSGRGLGAAIAKAFAPEGAALVINYRYSAEAAEELAEAVRARGGRAVAIEADVTDSRAVDAMFETAAAEFGAPVSTVVNNALADFSFNGDERQPEGRSKARSIRSRPRCTASASSVPAGSSTSAPICSRTR